MDTCLFCEICDGNIPSIILYEDERLIAFRDIDPKAPFHALIVPKQHIQSAAELTEADGAVLGEVYKLAAALCVREGFEDGYRVVTNVGRDGGQSVAHLHFHVLAGRALGWPPG